MSYKHWLLPEGVQEVLPQQAQHIETLRRQILDHYASWGYELVETPLIDYLSSLLTGTGSGEDLALTTATITDQLSGRLLGIRADMTPQVARIDAHYYTDDAPRRFCYIGRVLRTRLHDFYASRSPLQVGLELYGDDSIRSDKEVLSLLLNSLDIIGFRNLHLDLGHVSIYRTLAEHLGLTEKQENQLFLLLQRKALTDIKTILQSWQLPKRYQTLFLALVNLHGDSSVLSQAKYIFANYETILRAIDDLEIMNNYLQEYYPDIELYYDLSELRGYHYHTGLVFSAYIAEQGQCIAQGGRYDDIGEVFGYARPATGFSFDLALLTQLSEQVTEKERVYAPLVNDPTLQQSLYQALNNLRQQGYCVVQALTDRDNAKSLGCSKVLRYLDRQWQICAIEKD